MYGRGAGSARWLALLTGLYLLERLAGSALGYHESDADDVKSLIDRKARS